MKIDRILKCVPTPKPATGSFGGHPAIDKMLVIPRAGSGARQPLSDHAKMGWFGETPLVSPPATLYHRKAGNYTARKSPRPYPRPGRPGLLKTSTDKKKPRLQNRRGRLPCGTVRLQRTPVGTNISIIPTIAAAINAPKTVTRRPGMMNWSR